ncbi:MAG: Proline--tRNA ligase [candidate division WS2 bacterium]|nr:Proline--tRNA ligase [Candidatus Psychracetigena formicireducens]
MKGNNHRKILEKLKLLGCSPKVIDHDPVITMDDVVNTLDIPAVSMAKTIILFQREIGLIAVVLPGMNKIDYSKIANVLHVSRKTVKIAGQGMLINFGLSSGNVCPFYEFFQKTVVDTALLAQQFVYCGSGDPRKTIMISSQEMVSITVAIVADVSQQILPDSNNNKKFKKEEEDYNE